MRKVILFTCLFIPICVFSQTNLKEIRKSGYQVFTYKINADLAEKYIRQDSIAIDAFLERSPDWIFPTDSVDEKKLASGQYVLLSVVDNRLIANLTGVSDLCVYTINDQQRVQLFIVDKKGDLVQDARIWVNGKSAPYQPASQSYRVSQKDPDEAFIKIYAGADTLFTSLMGMEKLDKSVSRQRWDNFKRTWLARTFSRIPKKFTGLFKTKYRSSLAGTTGLMVFNQPKFKSTDTVKLKAYLFDKNRHPYRKVVDVFLEYFSNGANHKTFLRKLAPSSPGSYFFQFPLSDTLPSDQNYTINFKSKDNKRLISKIFRIEDYLLDEISSYTIRSSQETYYPRDTIHIFASAKDANGLSLLDARVRLILTSGLIGKFYRDSLYIPDTLFVQEKPLLTEGETRFDFPAGRLPDADFDMKAKLEFTNSNNELQEKDLDISYRPAHSEFISFEEKDSVIAQYREAGKIVKASGIVKILNDRNEAREVQYPSKLRIDPFADGYIFYRLVNGRIVDSSRPSIGERYEVEMGRISHGDTLGFTLNNPFRIPVFFTVFDGNKIMGNGSGSTEQITWTMIASHKNRAYKIRWQYRWMGTEQSREGTIALLYKLLNIEVKSSASVFPGQKDTIAVNVTDYKNRPAVGVNLTAFSYNKQFTKDIHVPEPPYLVRYKIRPGIKRDEYQEDDNYIFKKYPLGLHAGWIKKFGLDSMLHYQMLFPAEGIRDVVTPIQDFLPQISVQAVQKGERQEIYMLYVDRNLVYYNGVTEKMNNAYATYLGYTQVGIRLYDKFIEIDSIYTQPNYKHDLFIDIDHLPAHAKVTMLAPALAMDERALLERKIWQLDGNGRTNYGYIWQNEKLVYLSGNHPHLAGPFQENDSLSFFAPGDFDIRFKFEPGYQYNMSRQVLRLEKNRLFPDPRGKVLLPKVPSPTWIIGDTLPSLPVIRYEGPRKETIRLKLTSYREYDSQKEGNGQLIFTVAKDTLLSYVVLYDVERPEARLVLSGGLRLIKNIKPGKYRVLLVSRAGNTADAGLVSIRADHRLCIHMETTSYKAGNSLIDRWMSEEEIAALPLPKKEEPSPPVVEENIPLYYSGSAGITGKVLDKKGGNGIPGAIVMIRRSSVRVATGINGSFLLSHIRAGKYILICSAIGYMAREIEVEVPETGFASVKIDMIISEQNLNDVVVIGYGTTTKRLITGSIITVKGEELTRSTLGVALEGRVAGLVVSDGNPGDVANIQIRGMASLPPGQRPLYIVDGILYDEMPANISPDMIESINILRDAEATAIYGSKAANGAVVITTKTKNLRTQFRDYAFWQPELFTDRNGQVKFSVEYPDNVTGWENYVLAMDKKKRMGKSVSFIQSYKPLLAQISMPQFLIAGDTVELVGKSLNYSRDDYHLQTGFTIDGQLQVLQSTLLKGKESLIQKYTTVATTSDTLRAGFNIQSSTGYKDGEERKIPILRKGVLESKGQFWVLQRDTTVVFRPSPGNETIECFAQNNTLDILLSEIGNLKKYPWYCMEQTASKLRGLLMERTIRKRLGQPFTEEAMIHLLVGKLQKGQLYDGGWGWWDGGKPNLFITGYAINALLPLRSDPLVETNIRNGLLYLQNQLPSLHRDELLSTLLTMSLAQHLFNYADWLKKIPYDSLTIHQQWEFVRISQLQGLEYSGELNALLKEGIGGMLGSLHWGEDNYRWASDVDATTVLAFEVLQKEGGRESELNGIIQYFLEQRKTGYWRNTVASASIVAALLPHMLSTYKDFAQPAVLNISGDTSFSIRQYPFRLTMHNDRIVRLNIQKTGGDLTYLTFYQNAWNSHPLPVSNNYVIRSHFEKNGHLLEHLVSGEKVSMIVDVDALKEAEYVMIEIPIPAGCTYGSKAQNDWNMHKEFLKNKVVIFAEKLGKGPHQFEIELESRYNGKFTLNPVKVSLMYFPTFYGRNEMREERVGD